MVRPGVLVVLSFGVVGGVQAQARAGFVTRLGADTFAVERYTRSTSGYEGDLVMFSPSTRFYHYKVELTSKGTVGKFELSVRPGIPGPGSTPAGVGTAVVSKDTATIIFRRGEKTDTQHLKLAEQSAPFLFYSAAFWDQLTHQARAAGKDSLKVDLFSIGASQVIPTTVIKRGADSVSIDLFGSPIYVRVDGQGNALGTNGARTTIKTVAQRVDNLDIEKIAESFLARERAGKAIGQASPRDTVRATVGGAELTVDYGRPKKRGREIFGGIVAWNDVWRTGANAATQFTTSKDLVANGVTIPAGTYTLWTLPNASGSKLIINKQTKQWGTEYHPEQDLVRLDLKSSTVSEAVESFTIGIRPDGNGGALTFAWDRTQFALPFQVK